MRRNICQSLQQVLEQALVYLNLHIYDFIMNINNDRHIKVEEVADGIQRIYFAWSNGKTNTFI